MLSVNNGHQVAALTCLCVSTPYLFTCTEGILAEAPSCWRTDMETNVPSTLGRYKLDISSANYL